jgi:hypothetical protein
VLKTVTLIQVEHADEVLKHAQLLADPETFFKPARSPSEPLYLPEDGDKDETLGEEEHDTVVTHNPPNLS